MDAAKLKKANALSDKIGYLTRAEASSRTALTGDYGLDPDTQAEMQLQESCRCLVGYASESTLRRVRDLLHTDVLRQKLEAEEEFKQL